MLITVHKQKHRLTSCVTGVVRVDRVHILDAAEQGHIWRLVSHHVPLHPDHHVTHCKGGVHVVDLSTPETLG